MDFTTSIFGDFAKFRYGKMPKKSSVKENGKYPIYSGYRYVGYYDEYNTEANQLIIVARGVGGTGDVKLTKEKCYLTNLSISVEIDTSIALPEYLYYYFSIRNLRYLDSGSAQSQITISDLARVEIPLPNIEIQKKIVHCLGVLDRKISANEAINDNLEQQAKALYKDWFLDFSPFSSDGTLPDGWRIGTVGDIIQLHDSKRVPLSGTERSKMAKLYPYYGATSLMDYVDNYLFDGIYLLLGEDGTVVDNLGFPILQYVYGRFWVNNHAHIITGKEGFSVEELYLFFGLTNIKSIVTGAVQQKVSQQNLKKVPAIIPSSTALSSFDELIQPIFSQIRNLRDENARLTSLRDILLPKLMSGELDVSAVNL